MPDAALDAMLDIVGAAGRLLPVKRMIKVNPARRFWLGAEQKRIPSVAPSRRMAVTRIKEIEMVGGSNG